MGKRKPQVFDQCPVCKVYKPLERVPGSDTLRCARCIAKALEAPGG